MKVQEQNYTVSQLLWVCGPYLSYVDFGGIGKMKRILIIDDTPTLAPIQGTLLGQGWESRI